MEELEYRYLKLYIIRENRYSIAAWEICSVCWHCECKTQIATGFSELTNDRLWQYLKNKVDHLKGENED